MTVFIIIDAPPGGDMKHYSRTDILSLLPEGLDDQFVIIFDDMGRIGEKKTVEELCIILKHSGIPFVTGNYSGMKNSTLICSANLSFLTSL